MRLHRMGLKSRKTIKRTKLLGRKRMSIKKKK